MTNGINPLTSLHLLHFYLLSFCPVLTAEQYQQHQEQLVLMQKQLEQSQFQANNPTTTIKTTIPTTTTNNTPTTTQVGIDEATPGLAVNIDTS